MNDTERRLSGRIRLEREARGWSLADLAARSGVSKAMISRIEREEASPTAALLVRLAGAFDLTLAGLLLRAEEDRGRVSRASDQPVWRDPASGYVRRQVFSRSDHPVEIVAVEMPAGAEVSMPADSYAHIRQALWVQEGELEIREGGEVHALRPGDGLGFGPPSEVTFANRSVRPCRYVVVVSRR